MNSLTDTLLFRLKAYFDPQRLGPLLAELFINLMVAAFVLAIFYLFWRLVSGVALSRWKKFYGNIYCPS